MNNLEAIIEICMDNCQEFQEYYQEHCGGKKDEESLMKVIQNITAAGYPNEAYQFIKLNPIYENNQKKMDKYHSIIQDWHDKAYSAYGCEKMGCDAAQIEKCFGDISRNKQGEINNSYTQFLNRKAVEKRKRYGEAVEAVEGILDELVQTKNKEAVKSDNFIKLLTAIARVNIGQYEDILAQLTEQKVATSRLKQAVTKQLESFSSNDTGSEEATEEDEVSELLRPYVNQMKCISDIKLSVDGHLWVEEEKGINEASNFVPIIEEKYEENDGVDIATYYKIYLIIKGTEVTKSIIIPAVDFQKNSWISKNFGGKAILNATKYFDKIRCVALKLAEDKEPIEINYGLGWKQNHLNGKWGYCFSGVCVGEDDIKVAEMRELVGYTAGEHKISLEESFDVFAKMFQLLPEKSDVMLALISYAMGAPLIEKLWSLGIPPKFVVWLHGTTGSFKTTISLVLASLYGTMENPPANFQDTKASIEKKLHLCKDALLLVDDFFPSPSQTEERDKVSKASILTRNIGDRVARGRAKSNMQLSKTYRPLCNVLVTGEDVIGGLSTISRHLTLPLHRGDTDIETLTYLQNNKAALNQFMQSYLLWLKDYIMDNDKIDLKKLFIGYRKKAQSESHHRRFAEMVAQLQLSIVVLSKFLVSKKLISKEEKKQLTTKSHQFFLKLAEEQNQLMVGEDTADMFMTTISEMLVTGEITPLNPRTKDHSLVTKSCCFKDEDYYYFIPSSIYAKVVEFYLKKNSNFNYSERAVWQALKEKKYLEVQASTDGHADYKIKCQIGSRETRVIKIKKSILETF